MEKYPENSMCNSIRGFSPRNCSKYLRLLLLSVGLVSFASPSFAVDSDGDGIDDTIDLDDDNDGIPDLQEGVEAVSFGARNGPGVTGTTPGGITVDASFTNSPAVLATSSSIAKIDHAAFTFCLLYTSPSPRDATLSRMPSSA